MANIFGLILTKGHIESIYRFLETTQLKLKLKSDGADACICCEGYW